MTRRKLHLHIDRITARGARLSESELAAAIKAELSSLIETKALASTPTASVMVRRLDGGRIGSKVTNQSLGRVVARAARGALKP